MASASGPDRPRHRLGVGAAIVVIVLALAVTVGIGIWRGTAAPTEDVTVSSDAGSAGAVAAGVVYVDVAGAVAHPGLYRLSDGDRVVDAIASAGGFAVDADRAAVNLARMVDDGEQLVVPVVGQAPTDPGAEPVAGAAGAGDGRVDLNTADEAALDTLPRIGPAMAQRIIAWRDENGRFTSVEDLLAVPGIGEKMLESLRDLVTV